MALEIDFETRSDVDIRKRGVYVYMEGANTSPILASYKLNGGPVQRWRAPAPCPPDIRAHVEAGGEVHAHNAQFERLLWQKILTPRYGWPVLRLEQCRCTAAMAAAMGLPRDLAGLGKALGLATQKDDEGYRLMLQLSKPRKPRKGEDPAGLLWREEPDKIDRLHAYCDTDVETEASAEGRMVSLSSDEQEVYFLDQRINDRGVRIDVKLVRAMMRIVEQAQQRLDREMVEATGGYVTAASQVARLTNWLRDNGVPADSLAKAAVDDLLSLEDVPASCRRALEIRKEAAKSSTAKLKAALACVGADGRARGLLLYHGAGTGRWSGKLLQPQNFPRGSGVVKDPTAAARWMMRGDAELVQWMYGPPLAAVSDCLRSIITADQGKELLAADFANIEGRVNAWLAGEDAELDAFRAYDAGTGPDLYKVTASGVTGKPVDAITPEERQALGKVPTLALGFQGGVNAFYKMGLNYPGTDKAIRGAFGGLWDRTNESTRAKAEKRWGAAEAEMTDAAKKLGREGWIAAELTKLNWRMAHPAISASWGLFEDAIREAVQNPGAVVSVLRVRYLATRGFLWCQLPSGRCLAYGSPKLHEMVWVRWLATDVKETMEPWAAERLARQGEVEIQGPAKRKATALGVDSATKKWLRFGLYGGLACENNVQAIARDIMAAGMLKVEATGYPIVLTVHDDVMAEVTEGFGSLEEFGGLLCDAPAWAAGLPVVAEGWRGPRMRK